MSFIKSLVAERTGSAASAGESLGNPGVVPMVRGVGSGVFSESELLARSKRRHDLKASYLVFQSLCELVEEGYRFDDELASAHLIDLRKALRNLESYIHAEECFR